MFGMVRVSLFGLNESENLPMVGSNHPKLRPP